MHVKIVNSGIVSAFNAATVGSKVIMAEEFLARLVEAVGLHNFAVGSEEPGQGVVKVLGARDFVASGVGLQEGHGQDDFVPRPWRGKMTPCLKREFAAPTSDVEAVVYTLEAILRDPDVSKEEAAKLQGEEVTHVLVAVLAYSGEEPSQLTPHRFVSNLAGGNRREQKLSGDSIRSESKRITQYWRKWAVVAD